MKKIILVDPSGEAANSRKELLESEDRTVFVARTEEEVTDLLREHEIDIILLDPLLSSNFLIDDTAEIDNPEDGGVGFKFYQSLQKGAFRKKVKFILYSLVSKERLIGVGFPQELLWLKKGVSIQVVITAIE